MGLVVSIYYSMMKLVLLWSRACADVGYRFAEVITQLPLAKVELNLNVTEINLTEIGLKSSFQAWRKIMTVREIESRSHYSLGDANVVKHAIISNFDDEEWVMGK
jgi:hypothetical protein